MSSAVPKRGRQGPKDFAPDGSLEQQNKVESAIEEWKELREVDRVLQLFVLQTALS